MMKLREAEIFEDPQTLLSRDCLLVSRSVGYREVLARNFHTKQKIFEKKFSGRRTLWTVEGTEVTRVQDLEGLGPPVFCPARQIIVSCDVIFPISLRLLVYSLTGQVIKDRLLTVPTAFNFIKSFQVNDNQLVVMVRQQSDD